MIDTYVAMLLDKKKEEKKVSLESLLNVTVNPVWVIALKLTDYLGAEEVQVFPLLLNRTVNVLVI